MTPMSVIPNPATNEITLLLTKPLDEPGVFVLFDALGEAVLQNAVPVEALRWSVNTESLAPAMYQYQVRGHSGLLGVGKLTILR